MSTHHIFAIIGPSGVGKTTLSLAIFGENHQIVSFTSREPRLGEKEGIDYYFIGQKTPSEIEQLKQKVITGEFIEMVEYNNNVYGYTRLELSRKFNPESQDAAAIVTKEGYDNLVNAGLSEYIIPVFITASKETIIKHMASRNDDLQKKQERLMLYEKEIKNKQWFEKLTIPKILIDMDTGDLKDHIIDFENQKQKILESKI